MMFKRNIGEVTKPIDSDSDSDILFNINMYIYLGRFIRKSAKYN